MTFPCGDCAPELAHCVPAVDHAPVPAVLGYVASKTVHRLRRHLRVRHDAPLQFHTPSRNRQTQQAL
eukprot:5086722-Pleurochrysis_carterae.AAC.3